MLRLLVVTISLLMAVPVWAATEDLSTYTEVDPGNDIDCSGGTSCVMTNLGKASDSQVYDDKGASYFGNFEIDFKVVVSSITSGSWAGVIGVCEASALSVSEASTANDCIYVAIYSNAGAERWYMEDYENDNYNEVVDDNATMTRWLTLKRTGSTCTLSVWNDTWDGTHISGSPLTEASCPTTAYRYVYAVMSAESGTSEVDSFTVSDIDLNAVVAAAATAGSQLILF